MGKEDEDGSGHEVAEIQPENEEKEDVAKTVEDKDDDTDEDDEGEGGGLPITYDDGSEGSDEKPAKKPAKKGGKGGKKQKKEKPPPTSEEEPGLTGEEAIAEEEPPEETPKKGKKGKKGKGAKKEKKGIEISEEGEAAEGEAQEGEGDTTEPATEDATPKGKKGKGKKGKPKREEGEEGEEAGEGEEGAEPKGKGKKGKDKKGKKGKAKAEEGEGEGEGGEGEPKEKKDKKGKGKKGKGKKDLKPQTSKLETQMSISAFLKHYASMQDLADDEEWTWESYTASSESVKVEPPKKGKKGKGKGKKDKKGKKGKEEGEVGAIPEGEVAPETGEEGGKKGKGKGKGKKGKKGKKEKEEVPEVEVEREPSEVDIMAEIKKMKAAADAAALGEVVVEEQVEKKKKKKKAKKPKGEPKKKLTKAEKAKLEEQMRIQAELEAKQAEEEERLRLIEERKAAIEKEKREITEQFVRNEQLTQTISIINSLKVKKIKKDIEDKEERQWEQYLKCDGLPDPYVCGTLSTYLFLWDSVIESTTIEDAVQRTIDALELLDLLTTLIDDPIAVDQILIDNWKWVHRLFREHQHDSLNIACYKLLKDIETNFHRINFYQLDYEKKEDDFTIRMWLLQRLPKSLPNPRKPAPTKTIMDVPDMFMTVRLPPTVDCTLKVLRAMYVKYDHLSDLCSNFDKPPTPEQFKKDLYEVTLNEWYSKLYYKYENRLIENDPPPEEMPVVDREQGIIPAVPYQKLEPTSSEYFIAEEDNIYLQIREDLLTTVEEHVLNLRKHVIVGGIYAFEVFHQPPQPQVLVTFEMTVARLQLPQCLSEAPFYIEYEPPPPLDEAILKLNPEEIEEVIRTQAEEAFEKLMQFSVTLPTHVMYFDPPTVCHWDTEKKLWTDEDIYDLQYSEDGCEVTFRTGRLGRFGFAVYKYSNLPYQCWQLRPESDGSVTLQITAAILQIEFNVKNGLISVRSYENAPNKVLSDMFGIYYRLPKIIQILKEIGVDCFPDIDSFCYIEGACEKHWPVEHHTYYNMAQLSGKYNFSWSRWNLTAGRRNLVMLMRIYRPDREIQIPFNTLYVTPIQASHILCNEESEEFTNEIVEGMNFYSDLYNLMKGTANMVMKSTLQNVPHEQISAVAELLIATRVLSLA